MGQLDLICSSCPLADCDDSSLWCLYRILSGDPNAAQQAAVRGVRRSKRKPDDRTLYQAIYYQRNKQRKINAAMERYRAKKAQAQQAG